MSISSGTGSLEALLASVKLLHASLELEPLLKHLLRTIMGRLMVTRTVLALDQEGSFRVAEVRGLGVVERGDELDEAEIRAAGIEHILPIGPNDAPIGLLGIGHPARGELSAADHEFLSALLGIAATAIDNARAHAETRSLTRTLDLRVQELETLLDMVRGLTAALDPEEVAHLLGLTVAGKWLVMRWAVAAWKDGHPTVLRQRGTKLEDATALQSGLAAVDGPTPGAELADDSLRRLLEEHRADVLVPLRTTDAVVGCLVLGARGDRKPYSEGDLKFAAGLGAQAVVAFENAWNFAETLAAKKLEQELALAGEIQKALFPSRLPTLDGFDMAAHNLPAREVGGDYYDAIPIDGDGAHRPHLLTVADVSGKGIAASLIMSNIQAAFRALVGPEVPLTELVARCNDLIFSTTPANKFITAILAVVDPESGSCVAVNAGHNDGILVRSNGEVELIRASAPAIGMLGIKLPYKEVTFEMRPGDLLAFYSDGVTEANDVEENEFGDDRLVELLRKVGGGSAAEVVDAVFAEVERFATGAPQYDDITMMIVKRVE